MPSTSHWESDRIPGRGRNVYLKAPSCGAGELKFHLRVSQKARNSRHECEQRKRSISTIANTGFILLQKGPGETRFENKIMCRRYQVQAHGHGS